MDNSGQNSSNPKGILSTVAQHERELLAKVQETEGAAQRTVDSAQQEAARIASAAEKVLIEEIESMRRASEDKRRMERESILQAAQQQVVQKRSQAEIHLDDATREVVGLVLPGGTT